MKRIIAVGCSFTYGHGLEDCHYDGTPNADDHTAIFTPSKTAWPNLLAAMLNVDCVNLSEPGASNKYIAHRITEFDINSEDLVVVCWTHFSRTALQLEDKTILPIGNWQVHDDKAIDDIESIQERASTAYYKYMFNEVDCLFKNYVIINFVDYHVKSLGARIIHSSISTSYDIEPDLFSSSKTNSPKWNKVYPDIIFNDIIRYGTGLDHFHPSQKAHESFARRLKAII